MAHHFDFFTSDEGMLCLFGFRELSALLMMCIYGSGRRMGAQLDVGYVETTCTSHTYEAVQLECWDVVCDRTLLNGGNC